VHAIRMIAQFIRYRRSVARFDLPPCHNTVADG
jgi:hypothetical protein